VRTSEPNRSSRQGCDALDAGVSQSGRAALLAWRDPSLPRADTSFDRVILIDRHDRAIGTMPKLEAHRQGRRHRAISVIVRDTSGRLLLQQRATGKYHSAGMWTNTCCSHPRPGEDVADAAARRLVEEMGIVAPLKPLFCMRYRAQVSKQLIEHEFVHVFGGVSDRAPSPDASEVADWRWKPLGDVINDVDQRPQAYTVWFRKILREFKTEIARFVSR
jgi:isopentenyl-diphosphate delta-isomerase